MPRRSNSPTITRVSSDTKKLSIFTSPSPREASNKARIEILLLAGKTIDPPMLDLTVKGK